ncbi:MAG: Fe-S oxidoreductase family protein [uncultured bacterium]|nr:MAG: Fe-S oxidoreductase family protein [uncultured bacterium]
MRLIYYKEPIYRPPSEAQSLLIQATEGCSYNCDFCLGNEGKKFLIRSVEHIKHDIFNAHILYGDAVRKMFLLDGNAFIMKPESLIEIAKYSFETHPNLTRIGAYAHAKDVLIKSDEELKEIAQAGIKIVYLGIETGDKELLAQINKKVTSEEIIEAVHKLYKAGITLSATVILGLAGNNKETSKRHAIETAKLLNRIKPPTRVPWYISALTLMLPPGTVMNQRADCGEFKAMAKIEILEELKIILENLDDDLHKCIFRSNHASNYLPLESNNLARNKQQLVVAIQHALEHPEVLKSELFRSL